MGYPTRVQLIKRKSSHQWYVNFPAAIAEAMEFEKSELGLVLDPDKVDCPEYNPKPFTNSEKRKPSFHLDTLNAI